MDQNKGVQLELPDEEQNVSHEVSPGHQDQDRDQWVNDKLQVEEQEDSLDKELKDYVADHKQQSLDKKSLSKNEEVKNYFNEDTQCRISELKKRRSEQLLAEMDNASMDSPKIKVEIVTNNSPSNSLRDVKMPKPILRKKSKYFDENYKPKVYVPMSKSQFKKVKEDVLRVEHA